MEWTCLLYTSDAADERSSVDLGGRRIIKKKKHTELLYDNADRTTPSHSTRITLQDLPTHTTQEV